jgi:hypothetical protein
VLRCRCHCRIFDYTLQLLFAPVLNGQAAAAAAATRALRGQEKFFTTETTLKIVF